MKIEGNSWPSLTLGDPNIFACDRGADAELRQTRRNDRSFPFVSASSSKRPLRLSDRERVTNRRRQVSLIRRTFVTPLEDRWKGRGHPLNLQLAASRFKLNF